MIYLIGGPPRSGKTTLAKALAKKKSIPYFSMDHVTSIITPYISKKAIKNRLPLRMARQETNYSNDTFYARYSSKKVIGLYLRQAQTFWPGIENFVKYAIQDDHGLILEGWQITPRLASSLVTPENKEKIKVIFLYKIDPKEIISGLKSNKDKNDWAIKNTRCKETFPALAKMLSHFGTHIRVESKKHHFQAINMDIDFKHRIKNALDELQ